MLSPRDIDIINQFLGGRTQADIAAGLGVSSQAISAALHKQQVQDAIRVRLEELGNKVLTFKLDAVDGAMDGIARLREQVDSANPKQIKQELINKAANDLVRISGLEPRKRVLVENNSNHGIDADTRDWFQQIIHEAGLNNVVTPIP